MDFNLLLIIAVTTVLTGLCAGIASAKVPEEVDYGLVHADNEFGFAIFSQLADTKPQENVLISPLSIAMALQMCYAGASEETQVQMAEVMRISGMPVEAVNRGNSRLMDFLSRNEDVTLETANSLWARGGIPFVEEYIRAIEEFYRAETAELDFTDPKTVTRINEWVSEKTHGKIDRIIDQLDPMAIMVLINAVYFKAAWQNPFNDYVTEEDDFTLANGTKKIVMMMYQHDDFGYFETETFQAVRLPYEGWGFEMLIFLPSVYSNLDSFLGNIGPENWNSWQSEFREQEGKLSMPRFKVEYGATLNDALIAIGMKDAFIAANADFSGITPFKPAWISRVIHKTYIDVDEKGTEAAAVTAIEMAGATAMEMDPPEPFVMIIDRPFFCAIRERNSGALLFMGSVYEPE